MDSGPYHLLAWQALAQEYGIPVTEADFKATFGQRNHEILRALFDPSLPLDELDRLSNREKEMFRQLVAGHITPLPGAVPLVRSLARADCPQALCSSTSRQNIELVLGSLRVLPLLRTIVSAEDVARGKPDPEGFLLAAACLGVPVERALVIEDSLAGVAAARAAGMRCLAVATTHPRERLTGADAVAVTLERLTAVDLLGKN